MKTKYDTDKSELEKEIPNVTDFVKKSELNELESKIPDISNKATKTALTTVQNKIPDVSNLLKKQIITLKLYKLKINLIIIIMAHVFNARIAEANLITKTEFDAKLLNLNRKIFANNKTKHLLVENELNNLKTFYLSYFIGKSHFEEDSTQNYLVFRQIIRCLKVNRITNTDYISSWKSKGLSAERIKPPTTLIIALLQN